MHGDGTWVGKSARVIQHAHVMNSAKIKWNNIIVKYVHIKKLTEIKIGKVKWKKKKERKSSNSVEAISSVGTMCLWAMRYHSYALRHNTLAEAG